MTSSDALAVSPDFATTSIVGAVVDDGMVAGDVHTQPIGCSVEGGEVQIPTAPYVLGTADAVGNPERPGHIDSSTRHPRYSVESCCDSATSDWCRRRCWAPIW